MEFIAVLAVIFLIAAALSWVTKIEIAYLFAPAIFFIAGWEFVFGFFGYLNLGMESLVFSIGLAAVLLLVKSGGFRSLFLKSSFAPSTIAFVSLSLISLYKSKDWVISQWDEFTHWGLVVKAMYEYSSFAPSSPVEMVAEKTPPGFSLFQYFVLDFSSQWREGLLFWATHLIIFSIVVSALANTSYKYLSEIFLKLFVAIAAASVFFNNFDTIYADPTLALAFGFLLFVAIQASHLNGRWGVVLAITAGFVTMTKATGIYFAAAAILVNIVATLFTINLNAGKKFFLALVPGLVSILTVGTVWITWRYYSVKFGTSIVGSKDTFPTGFNNLTNQDEVVTQYIRAFFDTYLNPSYSASLSSLYWTIICAIFFMIWAKLNGKEYRRRDLAIGATLIVTTAGYFGAILLAYLTEFGPGEAYNLASYARYIGTWYQGVFVAISMLIVSGFRLTKYFDTYKGAIETKSLLRLRKQVALYLVALMILFSFSSIMNSLIFLRSDQFKGAQYRTPFMSVKDAIKSANMPKQSKVWIIAQHSSGFEYYVLRYEMLDKQFGEVPWSIGSSNGEGDIWTDSQMTAQSWSQELREFDYVVLYSASAKFYDEFGSLFESGKIDTNSVYKVVKTDTNVSLSKVN